MNPKNMERSLNVGFSCPNIDGKVGTGGCIYCSNLGSGDFAGKKQDDLITQFNTIKNILLKKILQDIRKINRYIMEELNGILS